MKSQIETGRSKRNPWPAITRQYRGLFWFAENWTFGGDLLRDSDDCLCASIILSVTTTTEIGCQMDFRHNSFAALNRPTRGLIPASI